MKKVLVLLSTYNGERYLCEQIDSLYSQKDVEIHILVRDDNSSDKTMSILQSYKEAKGRMTILTGDNVGPACSFYNLINHAYQKMEKYDYYAFSDQDDIWYDNKLSIAVTELDKNINNIKFYYSNFDIIDSNGVRFSKGTIGSNNSYKTILFRNPCIGCSQVFSYGLLEKAVFVISYLKREKEVMYRKMLHDSLMSRLAFFLDAYVVGDNETRFGYRQHNHNVTHYTGKTKIRKFIDNFKYYTKDYPSPFSQEAAIINAVLSDTISDEKAAYLNQVANYKSSVAKTVRFAFTYSALFKGQLYISIYVFILIIFRRF